MLNAIFICLQLIALVLIFGS